MPCLSHIVLNFYAQVGTNSNFVIYSDLVRQYGGMVPSSNAHRAFVMKDFDANQQALRVLYLATMTACRV